MPKRLFSRLSIAANQQISHKPLMLLTYVAVCARLFSLLVIEMGELGNALWLTPLLGALLALPAVFSGYVLLRRSEMNLHAAIRPSLLRPATLIIGFLFALEAADVFSLSSKSASYATLYENSEGVLLLITFFAVTIIAMRGGNSAGGIAAIWLILTPFLYLLVLLSQRNAFHPRWLFPLFGPGLSAIWRGAKRCARLFAYLPFLLMLDDGDIPLGTDRRRRARPACLIRLFFLCAATVSLLCAVHAALYPVLPDLSGSLTLRIDLFLSTGKANRTAQFPLLLMWYASLLVCAVFFVYAGGRMLAICFSRDNALFSVAIGGVSYLFAALGRMQSVPGCLIYPLIAFWPAALILSLISRREGKP